MMATNTEYVVATCDHFTSFLIYNNLASIDLKTIHEQRGCAVAERSFTQRGCFCHGILQQGARSRKRTSHDILGNFVAKIVQSYECITCKSAKMYRKGKNAQDY